jgi:membrane protease YdiL (CAAX protease family)
MTTMTLNSTPAAQATSTRWPWIMLFSRTLLFLGWQAIIALIYLLLGSASAWTAAAAWWPLTATLTNIVCLILLSKLFQREGRSYRDLLRIRRDTLKSDLLLLFGMLIISGPISYLPNPITAQWLFGNAEAPLALFVQPLPAIAAVILMVAFPISNGLAELPTYFGYVQPRLVPQIGRVAAVVITGLMLAFQHATLPLLFDARFIVWRLLMFVPFGLLVAVMLRWRPQLLPYMVVVHMLMDLSVVYFVLAASV